MTESPTGDARNGRPMSGLHVHLTPDEHEALSWLSDRYGSADVLWCATEDYAPDVDGPPVYVLTITPEVLRDYWRELLDDNGDPVFRSHCQDWLGFARVPPCAGGTLAAKLDRIPRRPDHLSAPFDGADLEVCLDCLCLIANGDTPDDLSEAATGRYVGAVGASEPPGWTTCTGSHDCEDCGAEMRAAREALGDPDPWRECEGWFSHSACDVCGSGRWEDVDPWAAVPGGLGGTRYHACTFPIR